MECKQVSDHLSDYLEGMLDPKKRAEIENHLVKCEKCRRDAKALEITLDILHSLDKTEASPDFTSRVMEKIETVEIGKKVIALGAIIGLLRIHRRAILVGFASFAITFGISMGLLHRLTSDRHGLMVNQAPGVEAYVIKEVVQPVALPQDTTSRKGDTSVWDEFDIKAERYVFPVSSENQPF